MSRENVEWVRRFFELYNRREIDSWVGMLAPDLEWHVDPEDPDTTVHRGLEAVKRHALYWAEMMDATFDVREVFEAGDDRAVAWTRFKARGELSGATVGQDLAFIFKLRDGLVVRVQETQDKREALEAVELREGTMSRENVEIVRRAVTAFACGDATAMLEDLDPDVVLHVENAGQGIYRGHEGVIESYVDWTEDFDDFKVVAEEFLNKGDCIVVRTRQTGSGKSSGVPMEGLAWFVCQVHEGKIVRMHVLLTEQAALEVVGLR